MWPPGTEGSHERPSGRCPGRRRGPRCDGAGQADHREAVGEARWRCGGARTHRHRRRCRPGRRELMRPIPSPACPHTSLPCGPCCDWRTNYTASATTSDPPVEVIVSRPLDHEEWPGLLYSWADDVTADRALRALVTYRREYAPGFWTHVVSRALAEHLRRRCPCHRVTGGSFSVGEGLVDTPMAVEVTWRDIRWGGAAPTGPASERGAAVLWPCSLPFHRGRALPAASPGHGGVAFGPDRG